MTEQPGRQIPASTTALAKQVESAARRKLTARRHAGRSVWFGFGMMGMIGWSVVVPTLLGAFCGHWLDEHHPGKHQWTLTLLMAGLVAGSFTAWHWVAHQNTTMNDDQENDHD